MEKILNGYLDKIEKYLKPLPVSERVDIVLRVKSSNCKVTGKPQRKSWNGWGIPKNWQKLI